MGLVDQMKVFVIKKAVLEKVSTNRQTLLFSATIPQQLSMFAKTGLRDYVFVKLSSEFEVPDTLKMHFFICREKEKFSALLLLLKDIIQKGEQSILFAASKFSVDLLESVLKSFGLKVVGMYGRMDQLTRKEHIQTV